MESRPGRDLTNHGSQEGLAVLLRICRVRPRHGSTNDHFPGGTDNVFGARTSLDSQRNGVFSSSARVSSCSKSISSLDCDLKEFHREFVFVPQHPPFFQRNGASVNPKAAGGPKHEISPIPPRFLDSGGISKTISSVELVRSTSGDGE